MTVLKWKTCCKWLEHHEIVLLARLDCWICVELKLVLDQMETIITVPLAETEQVKNDV